MNSETKSINPIIDPKPINELVTDFNELLSPGQFIEELFSSIPGAFYFIKNRSGQFISGTDSFAVLMGSDKIENIIGKTDFDLVPDFLAKHFQAGDDQVYESGKPIFNQVELVPTESGSLDWHSTSKVPLFGKDNTIVGLAGVARLILDGDAVYSHHPEMLSIVNFLRDNFTQKISMAEVANHANISVSKQERLFKKMFGTTPLMYLQKIRLNAACKKLCKTKQELSTIAIETGFNDQTNMTRAFRQELKITPLKYRKNFSP